MDLQIVIEEFQDYLAPTLDVYEQAVYLYIFRHSRLLGLSEATIGFKSARLKIALGKGQEGARMAENTCYEKLRSLEAKGCLRVLGTERGGTRVRLNLPSEIPDLIPPAQHAAAITLEEMDFFSVPAHRLAIFQREHGKCFYCLRGLEPTSYVIEHVVPRPEGSNTYRNVVAACLSCNNKKGSTAADDFLRRLYREKYLSATEFDDRLLALQLLRDGQLKPIIGDSAERIKNS